jgi:hypothetical protein
MVSIVCFLQLLTRIRAVNAFINQAKQNPECKSLSLVDYLIKPGAFYSASFGYTCPSVPVPALLSASAPLALTRAAVQRICKYPLMFKEVRNLTPPDHTDYKKLCQVQAMMTSTASYDFVYAGVVVAVSHQGQIRERYEGEDG